MKSVQITRRFVAEEWGGTETTVMETSRRLLALDHPTEIVCSDALSRSGLEIMNGVQIRRFPYFYPYLGLGREARLALDKKAGNIFSWHLLEELLSRTDLDLMHLHTGKRFGAIGRHASRKHGIPYVITLHGGAFDVPAEEARSWTQPSAGSLEWGKALGWWVGSRRLLQDAAAVICVGESERKEVARRYPEQRVVFLPNGVDSAHFARGNGRLFRRRHSIPADREVLLCVGRIDPQKNQRLVIELLRRLEGIRDRHHLVLIGPVTHAEYHTSLLESIDRLELRNRVTLIEGLRPGSRELVDAYHAANLFLLPSLHEPFGIVILEAWAAGLPVIASRVGGIPSFVEHGRDGLLVPPGDPDAWISAITTILDSSQTRRELAETGRAKARRSYDWSRVTDQLMSLYEEVLSSHAPSSGRWQVFRRPRRAG